MKTATVILIGFSLLLQSNRVVSQKSGKYYNLTKSQILEFYEGEFVYKYSGSGIPFNCTDTIAFGSWKQVKGNKFLQLNSSRKHLEGLVETNISEGIKSTNTRSIYFEISNPIENNWEQFNSKNVEARLVLYRVRLTTDCDAPQRVVEKDFYRSRFEFEVPFNCDVKSFEIIILPTDLEMWMQFQPPRLVRTEEYTIERQEANSFEIRMPHLSECFMSAIPLNNDIIIVKNKDVLIWRGEEFHYETE